MTETHSLREMTADDLDMVRAWRNHPEILRHMYTRHEITAEEHKNWFAKNSVSEDVKLLLFEVNSEPLGYAKLDISAKDQSTDWGFYLAPGAPKGTGSKLGNAVLAFAFVDLRLETIKAEVIASNEKSVAFHKKMGFRQTTILENHFSVDDSEFDVICMSLSNDEWQEKVSGRENDS